MKNNTAMQARAKTILRICRQRVRYSLLGAVVGLLVACGGGGGGAQSAEGTQNSTPPELKTAVQSAAVKPDVVSQVPSTLSAVAGQSSFTVSSEQSASLPIGKIFIYNNKPFKVIGANSVGPTVVLVVQTPALDEVFDDLKMEIVSHAVQYDDAGNPVTLAQAGLIKRTAMQLGLTKGIRGLKSCVSLNGDFTRTNQADENEYGYEFTLGCSLGELFNAPAFDAIKINGTFKYSGMDKRIIDLRSGTDYQENDGSMSGDISLAVEPLDAAALKNLAGKTDQCKSKDAELVCEFSIYDAPTRSGVAIAGGVAIPYTIKSGVKVSLTISGSGEIKLGKWETTWTHVAGVKEHKKIIPVTPKKSEYASFTEPSVEGDLDLYLQGYMGAAVGLEGASLTGAEVSGGLYVTAAGELGSSAGSRCISVEPGFRLGIEANFLTFGDESLVTIDGKHNFPFSSLSKSWPTKCGLHRKLTLDYVIAGKTLYQADSTASSDGVDAYIASNDLIYQNNQVRNIVLDFSSTTVTEGYTFDVDAEVTDHSKNAVATYEVRTDDFGAHRRIIISPGDTHYGDTISLRIKAYIPELQATTTVTRLIKIKIEDALSASPSYSKEIKTDGREYWHVDHNYGGNTRALLTSARNVSSVHGVFEISKDNGFFDFWDQIDSENGNIPLQLVLKSAATIRGEGQAFNYVEFKTPTVDSIEIEPASPEVGDVITFTVKGNRLPADYKADIPNCLWVVERRTAGNKANNSYSTLERVFQCKNTAPGTDLIAKFGDSEFPKVFSVVSQTTDGFLYSPSIPKISDTVQFWLRNIWGQVKSVVWTLYEGASGIVTEVSNGATTYLTDLSAPYFSPGTQNIQVAYKDDAGTTLRSRAYQFELASDLTPPNLSLSGKTQTSVSLGWIAISGASYYALTRDGGGSVTTQSVNGVSYTDVNVVAGVNYSYSIKACNATACSVESAPMSVTSNANVGHVTGKLPHSGVTANQCYEAGSNTLVACSSAGALALNGQQDGHRADINAMSYSLVPNASGGSYSKEECVKDNVTGLIWEGKTQTGSRAGGEFVVFPGSGGVGFGTYVNNVNAAMLCGFNDWRIPSVEELENIVDYGAENSGVAIDANWFPNSAGGVYMTSTLHAVSGPEQWFITFSTGYVFSAWRSDISYAHVRLVRP